MTRLSTLKALSLAGQAIELVAREVRHTSDASTGRRAITTGSPSMLHGVQSFIAVLIFIGFGVRRFFSIAFGCQRGQIHGVASACARAPRR